jgi:hypothetical protein
VVLILRNQGLRSLLKMAKMAKAVGAEVLVKLEYFSPTESSKDRMARAKIAELTREVIEAHGPTRLTRPAYALEWTHVRYDHPGWWGHG